MNVKQNAIAFGKNILEKTFLLICILLIGTGLIGSIGSGIKYYGVQASYNSGAIVSTGTQQQLHDTHQVGLSKITPVDSNLINKKPVSRWRLNKNGYSQRYFELSGGRTERMQQLLTNYGRDVDELYPAIKTIARIHKVYPEVIICIAYADSSLGKHLKTKNNVGNVGNNDRGDRQDYDNIEQGFHAIGKVLNNRYLGHYISIDQLAGSSNPSGPNYATELSKLPDGSTIRQNNWYNNVLNCLGMIRNKEVPANFAFRF